MLLNDHHSNSFLYCFIEPVVGNTNFYTLSDKGSYTTMKYVRSLITLILLAAACTSIGFLLQNKNQPQAKDMPKQTNPPTEATVRLAAVGDILLHDVVYNDARRSGNQFDFLPMFASVKPYIEKADVAFANQESIIGGVEIGLSTYPSFNSPTEIADALAFTGFDVMSLANNHALDRGEQALQRSISYWDELGIIRTGAYTSQEDRNTIRTFSKNGITCAVLSYTYGLNGIDVLQKPHLVNLMQPEKMKQDVEQAKQLADAVIVILHFGTEYETLPNSSQKEVAQFLADLGVSIILGHHPHVLQPPEFLTGKQGNQTFVAYSLGNFLAGQENKETYFGGIIEISIKKKKDGRIVLDDPSFLPTFIYSRDQTNYRVIPLAQVTEKQYPLARERYEKIIQHMKTYLPTLRIVTPE